MGNDLWGWALIGAACSVAGMIFPFRRGVVGVMANLIAGMVGALVLGAVGWALLHGVPHYSRSWALPFAAAGSLASILAIHLSYSLATRPKRG